MSTNHNSPQTIYLNDYMPPSYVVNAIDLQFELDEEKTLVTAKSTIKRNSLNQNAAEPLTLTGENLQLISIKLNEQVLSSDRYQIINDHLTISDVPAEFILEIVTLINPKANTELSGLYYTDGMFCTQCEAEGFRRITYYLDRPDVLAYFTTTIIADKTRFPVLLSNGNLVAQRDLPNNQQLVTWQDPFKKPCYLFALVGGNLDCLEDKYITSKGRTVTLKIFADIGESEKCLYAMECVKKAMRWDEKAYGREYDLDIFMIVAIHAFNMGAMENKGLNIFNSKYIFAKPETATDQDYEGILSVVGHEYFHNWTGDRVTCRDWFQLSLKEGLTVFREQEFTSDMTSALVSRINDVKTLRTAQFKEDAGPLAHPVQPKSYIEINNFYTTTIYEKGAEIIHMLKKLIGVENFRKGMDIYFATYDGQAVTIEEFINSMETASGRNLTQFRRWYDQAGTPELIIETNYVPEKQSYKITVKQFCLATPGQPEKKPFQLPLAIGLLDITGKEIPLQLSHEAKPAVEKTRILEIKQEIESFEFINISAQPVPSVMRNFSAPVKLKINYTDADLQFLVKYDTDGFNQWDAHQQLLIRTIIHKVKSKTVYLDSIIETFKYLLNHQSDDKSFVAELLTIPNENYLYEQVQTIDVDGIFQARKALSKELAHNLRHEWLTTYQNNQAEGDYSKDASAVGQRRLKNTCLAYLMLLNEPGIREICLQQFLHGNNMTDVIAALALLANSECLEREQVLSGFYEKWKGDALVVDKWLIIQATSEVPNALQRIKALMQHPAFDIKNPNKVRSLIGAFTQQNLIQFHAKDGSSYEFLADQVLVLDKINPQIAARLLNPLTQWRRFDEHRQTLQRTQLERIIKTTGLSKDTYEIAAKSLA